MIWADIKKWFKTALGKWIGISVFGLFVVFISNGYGRGRDLYYLPGDFTEFKDNTDQMFLDVFDNQQITVDNQVIMGSKLDSIIIMLGSIQKQLNDNTENIKTNTNRIWDIKTK